MIESWRIQKEQLIYHSKNANSRPIHKGYSEKASLVLASKFHSRNSAELTFSDAALMAGLAMLDRRLLPCASGMPAFAISGLDTVEACLELSPAVVERMLAKAGVFIFVRTGALNPGGAANAGAAGTTIEEGGVALAAAAAAAYRIGGKGTATGFVVIGAIVAVAVEPDTVRVGVG